MEVKYILHDMNEIKNKMLEADWNSFKWSLVLKAQGVYKRLEKNGHLNKFVNMGNNVKMQKEMMMGRALDIIENIDNIVTYDVRPLDETTTEMTIYINKDYFIAEDIVKMKMGKTAKYVLKLLVTRQSLLNDWRKSIRETYTHNYSGQILNDDGEKLIMKT